MRRVVQSTRVSLDGVIGDLQEWGMAYFDSDAQTAAVEQLESSDAMLMGRNTSGARGGLVLTGGRVRRSHQPHP